jgi:hypothetical protein
MSLRRDTLFLAAWVLLALTSIVPASAQLKQLSIPDTTALKGDTLMIPIHISSLATSDSVYAGQINLSYNSGLMTIYGIETAGTLTQGGVSTNFNATTRQIAFASGTILTGSGTLVFLKVGTLLSPSALSDSIRITVGTLNEGSPGTSVRNGYFRFLSLTVSPKSPPGTFTVGDSIQFTVSGDQLPPLTWTTSNGSVATISMAGKLKSVGVGQIKAFVTDSRGLKDSTNLFAVNSAQLTSLTLSVHDTSCTQTLYFNLPIYITDVSALGIYSGQFSLTFNSSILQATDVVTAGSMSSGWSAPAFNITGGRIDVALAGNLVYIRFRVLPTASGTTTIGLSSVLFNENINALLVNRTFSTLAAPTVVITPTTATLTRGDTLRFRVTSGGRPPYAWSSSVPGIASINSSTGLLTGVTRGTTTVSVVDSLGFSATTGTININDLRVSVPDTTVAVSDSVDVPVRVEDLTGLGIYSYDLRIVYDSTIVRFSQLLGAGTMSSAMNIVVRDTLDTLRVGAAGSTALTGAGALFNLRFKAAPGVSLGQSSSVGFVFFRFNEVGSSTPTATMLNGRITIGTPATPVPSPPALAAPTDGSTNVAVNPTLSWNASSGATSYTLQVSTASNFSALVVNQSGLSSPSYAASGFTNNTLYYWRASATNANGTSAYSTAWSFTTVVAPPGAPTRLSPADSATNIAVNPTFIWNSSVTATSYTVQISTNSGFSSFVVNQSGIAGTSYNAGGLSTGTQYFWRVSATNGGGTSLFSAAGLFTTSAIVPAPPTLVSPSNGAVGVALSPTHTWNGSIGAVSYTLQLSTALDFSTLVLNQSGLTSTSYAASGLTNNMLYFWRVSATNASGTSAYSTVSSFTTVGLPPAAPILVLPAIGATGVSLNPTLSWSASDGATNYTVQVSTASDFSSVLINQSGVTGISTPVSGLANNTLYYWRVSASNNDGSSPFSTASSFVTVIAIPSTPVLTSPNDTASNVSTNPRLTWSTSAGASKYFVEVSPVPDFSTLVRHDSVTGTSDSLTGLTNNTKHYWRVRAANAGGTSPFSTAFSFTTIAAAPSAPTLLTPADTAKGISINPTLTWSASAGATRYTIQLATAIDFSIIVKHDSVTGVSLAVSGLANNTKYYWRVRATNAGGTSPYSLTHSFTTIAATPAVPSLTSPANGAVSVAVNPALSWNTVIGATSYTLQVSTAPDFSVLVATQSLTNGAAVIGPLSPSTLYYWRVGATNAGGTSAYSTAFSFTTIIAAPAAPSLTSPANGAVSVSVNPALSWNTDTGATSYTLQVSTAPDFSVLVATQSLPIGAAVIGPLSPSTLYYWRVSAANAGGTSAYSIAFSFTTIVAAPAVPSLTSPTNGAVSVALNPAVSWNTVTGATSYTLQFSTASDFSVLVATQNLTNGAAVIGPLSPNTLYYWRVSASNAGGSSAFSSAFSFTTLLPLPSAPLLVSPADKAINVSTSAFLRWNSISDASLYHLQVSISSGFGTTVVDLSNITDVSVTVTLALNTTYFWRVSAVNATGGGPFSPIWSFSTVRTTSVEMSGGGIPDTYALGQNYPNPFNPSTIVPFSLPKRSGVHLSVFSLLGNEIAVLVDGEVGAGYFETRFDAGKLPSGVYLLRLQATALDDLSAKTFFSTRKMVLVK